MSVKQFTLSLILSLAALNFVHLDFIFCLHKNEPILKLVVYVFAVSECVLVASN